MAFVWGGGGGAVGGGLSGKICCAFDGFPSQSASSLNGVEQTAASSNFSNLGELNSFEFEPMFTICGKLQSESLKPWTIWAFFTRAHWL